jgi:hypothetical protein
MLLGVQDNGHFGTLGSNLGRTSSQGLKITDEKELQ